MAIMYLDNGTLTISRSQTFSQSRLSLVLNVYRLVSRLDKWPVSCQMFLSWKKCLDVVTG